MKKKKDGIINLKRLKITGKIRNGNYKDLKIIDIKTGKKLNDNLKGFTLVFRAGELPTVSLEYNADRLEFDIEIEENNNEE